MPRCLRASQKFLDVNGVDNIEYFPATVIEKKGQPPKTGYSAANIIGLVDCIDKENSEFDGYVEDGELKGIASISELALLEGKTYPAYIFRMYLFWRIILIHESFKRILEEAGISGVILFNQKNGMAFTVEKKAIFVLRI